MNTLGLYNKNVRKIDDLPSTMKDLKTTSIDENIYTPRLKLLVLFINDLSTEFIFHFLINDLARIRTACR